MGIIQITTNSCLSMFIFEFPQEKGYTVIGIDIHSAIRMVNCINNIVKLQ